MKKPEKISVGLARHPDLRAIQIGFNQCCDVYEQYNIWRREQDLQIIKEIIDEFHSPFLSDFSNVDLMKEISKRIGKEER